MALSGVVAIGGDILASQYNNLRTDALNTRRLWSPVTAGNQGVSFEILPVVSCTNLNDKAVASFPVPADYASIVEVVFLIRAAQTEANLDVNIDSEYGATGEVYTTHSEADAATTYNVVINQWYALDISGILTGIVAGDWVGVRVLNGTGVGHVFLAAGILFRWL